MLLLLDINEQQETGIECIEFLRIYQIFTHMYINFLFW